jgi:hypothetical protein
MGNASSSSMGHSDSGSESDHDIDDLRDAVHSAILGGRSSTAVSAGNNSSAAGQLAMRHNIYYDVTQFVTDYDAINVFGLMWKDLKGLKYQKRYIQGVCRQGMRMNVSHLGLADACPQKMQTQFIVHQQLPICLATNYQNFIVCMCCPQQPNNSALHENVNKHPSMPYCVEFQTCNCVHNCSTSEKKNVLHMLFMSCSNSPHSTTEVTSRQLPGKGERYADSLCCSCASKPALLALLLQLLAFCVLSTCKARDACLWCERLRRVLNGKTSTRSERDSARHIQQAPFPALTLS